MRFQKGRPGRLPLSFRRGFDAVFAENVTDSGVRQFMAKIGQRPLNAMR
jgi:hypothetical protein